MVWVKGSWTNQSCSGDEYLPFEPSSRPLGQSQVAPDPPWPKDGAARQPWLGSEGHGPTKAVQGSLPRKSTREFFVPRKSTSEFLCAV